MEPSVGELFILGFRGMQVPDWLREFEDRFGLGGVILFDYDAQTRRRERNIESSDQVRALCAAVHDLPSRPLVFVDQEGGQVRRLREDRGFAPLPSAQAFNLLPDPEKREIATTSFRELAGLGIDFDLAPVVDLNSNPENPDIGARGRSFSADPEEVTANVRLLAEVAEEVGLGLCLKHYPGLGGATTNSHEALTDISGIVSDAQLQLFLDLAKEIPGHAVLVSHGIVDEWEPGEPVSMSPVALERLRRQLPDALLLSDDVQMQGLQLRCGTVEGSLRAVQAGLDMVIVGNNLVAQEKECFQAAAGLRDGCRGSRLRGRITRSIQRVRSRKGNVGGGSR